MQVTFTEAMILIVSVFALILTIAIIIMAVALNRMKNKMVDLTNFVYQLMRQNETSTNSIVEVSNMSNTTNETLSTLTSSIRSVMKKMHDNSKEKIYPGPELLALLDRCIQENVLMYASLIKNDPMPENPQTKITEIVMKTFPHIDEKYIIQRTIYIMEEFNNSRTGRKSE